MYKHGPEGCQEGIYTVEEFGFSYRRDTVTDFVFSISCNLVELFGAVLRCATWAVTSLCGLLSYPITDQ